ncbi:MAG: amidohydrolase family protein [Proteobacteria bacterium]|nr:amidohydrolase family protein [Pseudomonadota bacterium]
MVVDCHYHHIPETISTDALIKNMDQQGIDRIALMASLCGPLPETKEILITFMRFGLNRSWLRNLPKKLITKFSPEGNIILPSGLIEIYPDIDNSVVFDEADRHPDRFFAWCMVKPGSSTDPVAEYERWEKHPACIGVKAHPFWHRYAPIELLKVSERLVRNNKPLILHLGFDNHGDILSLANALPELKIILAHTAFPCYSDTWKLIKERKNISVDFSATAYVDPSIMKKASDYLGIERCIYGSDGPFGSHGPHGHFDLCVIKKQIEDLFQDPGKRKRILGENFMECIGRN